MNRLYGLIAAVCVCFGLFMTLALAGRKAGSEAQDKNAGKGQEIVSGTLEAREPGRFLRLAIDTEPQTLDPISVTDTISDGVSNKLYNKLVRLKADASGTLVPVPDLAESFDVKNDRIYTFRLRKGVKFHNGREVKASDFVYSLKRLMSPMSKRPELMQPFIKGSKAYYDRDKGGAVTVDDPNLGIKALDDYTLQIELDEPFAPFLQHLSTISCAVVPREAAEDKDRHLARAPVGTGPFKLAPEDWLGNQELSLKRFDEYFNGKPKLDGIKFYIYKDRMLQLKKFMAGQLDASVIPNGKVKWCEEHAGKENLLTYANARTNYIGVGMPNGKFTEKKDLSPYGTNKLLRQAMSYALDREYICHKILEERAIPAIGVLPPGMPACKLSRPPMKQDLNKARDLLAQAGYPNGKGLPPVTMLIRNDEDTKNIAQAIKHDLDQVGFSIHLQPREWNRFLEEVENEPQPMFLLGWVADYPDPDNFLYVLFNKNQFGSAGNHTFFDNPKVNELTDKARTITNMDERAKLYEQAEDIILDESPWICTYHVRNKVLFRREVKGIRFNATLLDTGTEFPQVDFKDVDIGNPDEEEEAPLQAKVGQTVVLKGTAVSAKLGPVLETKSGPIYVLGLKDWPEEFKGTTLSVGGLFEERSDMPVSEQKPGEPIKQGVPVKEGTDLKAASRRYVIKLEKLVLQPK